MSLATRINDLATRVANEFNTLRGEVLPYDDTTPPTTGQTVEFDGTNFVPTDFPPTVVTLSTFVNTEVTLTTASTAYLLPATEMTDRKAIVVYNKSANDVYLGGSGVTTTTGLLLSPDTSITLNISSSLYAICATASTAINVLEMK